jgi:hypothetical protein
MIQAGADSSNTRNSIHNGFSGRQLSGIEWGGRCGTRIGIGSNRGDSAVLRGSVPRKISEADRGGLTKTRSSLAYLCIVDSAGEEQRIPKMSCRFVCNELRLLIGIGHLRTGRIRLIFLADRHDGKVAVVF